MYTGKVNLKEPDMNFTQEEFTVDSNKIITLFSVIMYIVALKRSIKVVIVDCENKKKRTRFRKVFFSANISMIK